RLPSVISFSTIGRNSLALGSVVTICSCLISAADMFANMARRWLEVRLSFRLAFPWHILVTPWILGPARSVMIFVALGEIVDVFRRPAGNVHAEMKPHLRQHFLDLVKRLAPEIGRPEHLGLGL